MSVEKMYVISVNRPSAQGRSNYEYKTSDGNTLQGGRSKSKGAVTPLRFYRSENRLLTGLDKTVTNPYKGMECTASNWLESWDKIEKAESMTLQQVYEIKDNVKPGTYTSIVTTPTMVNAMNSPALIDKVEKERTYLEGFTCYLEEGPNPFTADTERGRWSILLCKNHPYVAKSAQDVNPDIHEFYIGEEEEAVKEKVEKRNTIMEGSANLGMLLKTYPSFVHTQFASILKVNMNSAASEAGVKNDLQEFIFEDRKTANGTQIERIEKFNTMYELLEKEPDRIYIKYLIEQAVANHVILLEGGRYIWRSQKGIDNLYNLGVKGTTVENLFLNEYSLYDPKEPNTDNAYEKMITELKAFGVKVK